jgi:hypothetical protein
LFFSQAAMSALQYPPVSEQVKKRSRYLLSFASGPLASEQQGAAAETAFGGTAVDANALGWALSAVSSRAFRLRGPSEPASMLPLIDMCNHSFQSANCEVKQVSPGQAALVATRRIFPGEPLLICYGQSLNNDLLLLDYGFVEHNSHVDTVALRFSGGLVDLAREVAGLGHVPFGASSYEAEGDGIAAQPWQQAILADLGLVGRGANLEVLIGAHDAVDPRLLAALRVLYTQDGASLSAMTREQRVHALTALQPGGVVSPTVERCALATAAAVCAVTLSQWPTTQAQDEGLLGSTQGAALPPDVLLATRFRAEKKRCLSTALAKLKARLEQASGVA